MWGSRICPIYWEPPNHVSNSLNFLKGAYVGVHIGDHYWVIKGDLGSLDYSSCVPV